MLKSKYSTVSHTAYKDQIFVEHVLFLFSLCKSVRMEHEWIMKCTHELTDSMFCGINL